MVALCANHLWKWLNAFLFHVVFFCFCFFFTQDVDNMTAATDHIHSGKVGVRCCTILNLD